MRISDWSSDVCSSDLPVAPDHVAEFLSRARGRAECGSDVGRRLAVDEAGDRRRRGADGRSQSGTAAAMADELLDARHGGAGAGSDSRKANGPPPSRSEEHTSELKSLMRIWYSVLCSKKKTTHISTSC